jgi:hypothetical protein
MALTQQGKSGAPVGKPRPVDQVPLVATPIGPSPVLASR